MDPEVKQDSPTDFDTPESGTLRKLSSSEQAQEQWQQLGEQASKFLSELPAFLSDFFNEYRQPIVVVGLFLGIILTAKVALAVLGAINEIPLLSPAFEIIGIGYSAWFIYRYLLKASSRKELSDDFSALKEQVLGRKDFSPKE